MEFKDYYAILGVKPETPSDEIKRAYRKLARQYHPDVSKEPDAENKFKEIGEAWEVLGDKEKRAQYDQIRTGGYQHQGARGEGQHYYQQSQEYSPEQAAQFNDFFQSIFGGRGFEDDIHVQRQPFKGKGQDYHVKVAIPLSVAYEGGVENIQIQVPSLSPGHAIQTKNLQVNIPRGVLTGTQIRLKDQGGEGRGGGPKGDLYIEIEIKPHPHFSLQKKDVYLNLPLAPWEAALGTQIMVPTLGGNVNVKIPAHAQSGKKMRLKGRGMPGEVPGDQYIVFQIQNPDVIDDKGKAFFEEMAKIMPFNPRTHLGV